LIEKGRLSTAFFMHHKVSDELWSVLNGAYLRQITTSRHSGAGRTKAQRVERPQGGPQGEQSE